jgi:acyl-CoA reductase-like NAD-dependent aldehyde dehydrogenase
VSQRDKNAGFFVPTTIFTDLTDTMKINQEEIFGPVLCVLKFKTEEEVIERANSTSFGLAAGVHTRDIKIANRVVNNLDAGIVWVSCYNVLSVQLPFGGFKVSLHINDLRRRVVLDGIALRMLWMSIPL